MARKTGLGRGLDALIPTSEPQAGTGKGIEEIPVDRIQPNPRQPRVNFDQGELLELAKSLREHGVIQPLIVTLNEDREGYTLIAGERRLRAAQEAGMKTVPAIIREVTEQQQLELAVIENLQRADLNPLESADAYRQLVEDFHLTHEEIALRVGKSRAAVSNTLRLLSLPPEVKEALIAERISEGHARALLALPTAGDQNLALQIIMANDLNVRKTEDMVRKWGQKDQPTRRKSALTPELQDLEERLRSRLGTRVNLNPRRHGGTVVIHYYSDEELNSLMEAILGELE
jgi:ParB family chromosome partitioning protein